MLRVFGFDVQVTATQVLLVTQWRY